MNRRTFIARPRRGAPTAISTDPTAEKIGTVIGIVGATGAKATPERPTPHRPPQIAPGRARRATVADRLLHCRESEGPSQPGASSLRSSSKPAPCVTLNLVRNGGKPEESQ